LYFRYIKDIWDKLLPDKSLILLAGPRQSGKTTFAQDIAAKDFQDVVYFNWDIDADKRKLIADPVFFSKIPKSSISSKPLVILDEIHKYRDWKNYLKGVYEEKPGIHLQAGILSSIFSPLHYLSWNHQK